MIKRPRSKLETLVNQYRHNGAQNGKGRKLSTREFAKQVNLGESTLYLRWREPETFQDKELKSIAHLLSIPFEQAKELSTIAPNQESPSGSTATNIELKNRALIEQSSTSWSTQLLSSSHFRGLCILLILTMLIVINWSSLSVAKQSLIEPDFQSTFQGLAIDLDAKTLGEALDLHSKLYEYQLIDLKTQTYEGKITMEGRIEWSSLLEGGKQKQSATFSAEGKHLGDTAGLVYEIHDTASNETWIGTFLLRMPHSGPAQGYWISHHTDEDPISDGPFAIGQVTLSRP
ncbi:MAG TPA: hypothetical protein DCS35_02955 [Vibrio sp.]|nr:hypothetical protein [Vibrio sp.]